MRRPCPNNVFLTGFMGSGKSTVGPLLADALGWTFCDTDQEIERLAGLKVREIFERSGESVFRRFESQVVKQVAAGNRQIVALGGGALTSAESLAGVLSTGLLVYLKARPETLLRRLNVAERPLLRGFTGPALKQRMEDLLKEREPHYLQAPLTIETDELSAGEVAESIKGSWE